MGFLNKNFEMRKRTRKTRTPYDISAQNLEGWLSSFNLPIYQSHISLGLHQSCSWLGSYFEGQVIPHRHDSVVKK